MTGLPISFLINVKVVLEPSAAQGPNVDSLCIIGSSSVINVAERIVSYANIGEVATAFGTSAPEYLAALAFFSQTPTPTQLYIGRWAEAATSGLLIGIPLTAAQQAIGNWTSITNGGFTITIDGGSAQHLTGLDLHLDANLNAVASTINLSLSGAVMTWNGSQFVVTSNSTGASSVVSFVTAPGSGFDMSTQLGLTAAAGAEQVGGIVSESAVTAVTIINEGSTSAYAYHVIGAVDADHLAIAAYIEATGANTYFLTTNEAAALDPAATSDIGYQLKQLGYNRTGYQYSSTNLYADCSWLGRMFTVDFTQNNSTITAAYKQELGVLPEQLTTAQAGALSGKNYTYFAAFNNSTNIIVNGCMASGLFFDAIQGADWFGGSIATAGFNALYTTPTKIPQTDAGNHQLTTVFNGVCQQAVNNGLVGPGVWANQGFGSLNTGDYMSTGYYVYAPPIASQNQADREDRESVAFQIAAIFAGAVQKIGVTIDVQQ